MGVDYETKRFKEEMAEILEVHKPNARHGILAGQLKDENVYMISSGDDGIMLNAIAMYMADLIEDGNEKGELIWALSDMINEITKEREQ